MYYFFAGIYGINYSFGERIEFFNPDEVGLFIDFVII